MRTKYLAIIAVAAIFFAACAAPATTPAAEAPAAEAAATAAPAEEAAAPADSAATTGDQEAELAEILACVEENFPAESYITNEFLPDPDAEWVAFDCDTVDQLKVLMPWVLNDEEAPWYNAVEKGYYADVCLEVELVPGGPGIQPIQLLAGGAVDIAVVAGASRIPASVASPTPADVVGVGTFLKHTPYIWMGLDSDIPQDQVSTKELTPEDLIGKKIGVQAGDEYFAEFLIGKYGLAEDAFEIVEAGFTPDPLLMGAMDYFAAWIVNQPRLAESQGYMNWTAFRFSEWGWDGYSDVSTVRREMVEANPELIRRYLAATHQGLKFLLENPEESAEIAVQYGTDAPVTKEQALRRFELQKDLIEGDDGLQLMEMSLDRWNSEVATQVQFGQIELPACQ
jgi:ABC-type nitrate/sulfonate/bicarbonate transport system substrate-binding protein